ncbi:Signal transduction histidine kinase CheA [Rubellimicrobium mesophilum DSM 19309]|uniref:Chemotaxis protein CheA n=1 Tax=Rubellimicrobium mesophilum DSM 19309 TaxID=442562 RepID=A0A017HL77_9RHOB|nr:chemotaxis protein CheA [Rubellimicrobium mesophilum]EYD75091.1 Signal transduction histidine kinase CheA [Rubellimicrobium mesophilum DSM 19309]
MTDDLRDLFFAESEDLVTAMGDGIAAMLEGSTEAATVNAVFRAVHSIKGAAGAFGLSDVVAFAHSFETVLDAIRSDRLLPDPDVLHLLQRAGDVLADLLEAAREGGAEAPPALAAVLDALEEIVGDGPAEEDLVFEPVGLAFLDLGADVPPGGYEIALRPGRQFYRNGHEPLSLLAALSDLGELTATCDAGALPPLAELDPEEGYLAWTLRLATSEAEERVRDVFAFVEDLCELSIRRLEEDPAPPELLPLEEAAAADPLPAPEPTVPPPVAPPAPASAPAPAAKDAPKPTLRVDLDRVDRLINSVGELIISQAVIAQKIAEASLPPSSGLGAQVEDLSHLARDIQEGVMRIRAQPLKPLFQRMARVVREAAEATGKQVDFVTEGEDTEVDRAVIDGLADPLMHMLRNAVDHGIEMPDDRLAKGKPAMGQLVLAAGHASGNVRIVIRDDGAGLDRARIRATAVRKGLIAVDANLSEGETDNLLFLPGFSTAASVTNLSGRGVGMDVARSSVMALGGRIGIASRPGKGTNFTISLPLTLAVLDGLILSVGGQLMVVPASSVVETIRPLPQDLLEVGRGTRVLAVRGDHVPVMDLAGLLRLGRPVDPARAVIVLVRTDEDRPAAALSVSEIVDKRQVVIKSLRLNVGSVPGVSGATILGDGKVALILDPDSLLTLAARRGAAPSLDSLEAPHDHAA